jgi:hypothetical protein
MFSGRTIAVSCTILLVISTLLGMLLFEEYSYKTSTLGNICNENGCDLGVVDLVGNYTYINNKTYDFMTETELDSKYVIKSGVWNITVNGLESLSDNENFILYKSLTQMERNQTFYQEYNITNLNHLSYELYIVYKDNLIPYWYSIYVSNGGSYIHQQMNLWGECDEWNSSIINLDTINYKIYSVNQNNNEYVTTIYRNDELICHSVFAMTDDNTGNLYLGGVKVTGTNFVINNLTVNEKTVYSHDVSNIWDFIDLLFTLVVWNVPESIMPMWLNVVLIKPWTIPLLVEIIAAIIEVIPL